MRALAPIATALIALASTATAAQITVGPGPGFDFAQITDALASAAPGDRLLVAAGTYDGFSVTQPVTVAGAGAGQVFVVREQNGVGVRVTGIAAGGVVRISGLTVSRTTAATGLEPFVAVDGCAGTVLLSDLTLSNAGPFFAGEAGHASVEIADSSQVMIDNSTFQGWPSPPGATLLNGVSGLHASNSTVYLSSVTLTGGPGGSQFKNAGLGAPALDLDGSIVTAARLKATGGGGGSFFGFDPLLSYSFAGSPGVDLFGSTLTLHGGPGNKTRGGYGGSTSETEWAGGGAALRVDPNSTLRVAADAVLEPGDNGDGSPGPVAIQPATGSFVVVETFALPTLGGPPRAPLGGSYPLDHSGEPGHFAAALLVLDPSPAIGLATVDGTILIAPGAALVLPVVVLDGAGLASQPLPVPNEPVLAGLGLTLQSIELGGALPRVSNALGVVALP